MSDENLWGDIDQIPEVNSPKSILKEQAAFLDAKTNHILHGVVDDRTEHNRFVFDLDIVVPSLNDYRYTVLTVSHGIDLYPVSIESSGAPRGPNGSMFDCDDEDEFKKALATILTSPRTKKVIASLLSQAKA
jgi:hypothetical protein